MGCCGSTNLAQPAAGNKYEKQLSPEFAIVEEIVDVVIIGAGFAGAYCAYELKKKSPRMNVVILEKTHVGGRLLSDDNDEDNTSNKDELGGMRVFPSVQPEVARVVKEVGCHFTPVRLNDEDNFVHIDGQSQRKGDFKISGRSPREMIKIVKENFAKAMPEEAKLDPYESKELRNLSLPEFLEKYGCSKEDIKSFFLYSGYDIFSDRDVQASIFFKEGMLYGPRLDADQRYVQEGFQEVVRRMVKKSKANLRLNCRATKVEYKKNSKLREVTYTQDGVSKVIRAKNVICALPVDSAQRLNVVGIDHKRNKMIDNGVKTIPLFKLFLEWAREEGVEQWWKAGGFTHGKSTTDLNVRQVHYYDNEDILIYNSGKYADEWFKICREDGHEAAAKKIFEQIQVIHGTDLPEPDWESTIFHYWINGSHKWRKGVDVPKGVNLVATGDKDQSNIHFCGDAFSFHQGWCAGCIETAEMCLKAIRQQK